MYEATRPIHNYTPVDKKTHAPSHDSQPTTYYNPRADSYTNLQHTYDPHTATPATRTTINCTKHIPQQLRPFVS